MQVKPYYEKGMSVAEYRTQLTPYRVNCDINVANDYITRIDNQSISLDNTQVSLKDYFKMMSQLK